MGLLKKKNNRSLQLEYEDLANDQERIRKKREALTDRLDELYKKLESEISDGKTDDEEKTRKLIDLTKEAINDNDTLYDRNTKNLAVYEADSKSKIEKGATVGHLLLGIGITGIFSGITAKACANSWTSDMTGEPMPNKQSKDMFKFLLGQINPVARFMK